jgi:hypothetical protein
MFPLINSLYFQFTCNYCHYLASVVCKLFTFQASSPKPPGQLEPNLAGMFLGWSSTKFLFFVPVGYSTWLPGQIICSDWWKFQRSSLKLMNWLNPNCKWMIIGMSFTKFLFFMPIGNPRWPPPQDIDYHWTLWENVQMPSYQKLQIWLKPNCTWMFIGWTSTNFRFFVPIWNSKWRLRQDLV